ncbi:MAG: HAD-IIIC family phosphatase [Rhodospirillaceae bacterium]|nr:HAD-IIIC family phosphatase [Rhodospirillaceae bacterium]
MQLRLSRFIHMLPVGADRVLLVDAISHVRLVVTRAFAQYLQGFAAPRDVQPDDTIRALLERAILTDKTPEAELAQVAGMLAEYHGRDPGALLEQFRRKVQEGAQPYWAVTRALGEDDFKGAGQRVDVILFGECDLQMEADFLRREAATRGIDLRVAATFPGDARFAAEHKHDAVIVGALRGRFTLMGEGAGIPHDAFIQQAREVVRSLRQFTAAPILVDNLPEPTVQPMGLAERGARGHRNRFRAANIALAEMAEEFADVHVVDVAAAFAGAGAGRLIDDGEVGFVHFGSPGWLLQRAESEKAAVHGIFPDLAPLADTVGGDPYIREPVAARAHIDALGVVLAWGRKKCVIVDLDGVLWPGVLAETGAPFAWSESVSGPYSFVGLFFGLHEALLALKKRGVLLACVSKNDEATVRALWKYEDHYPRHALLTPSDFVTWRVNWGDKVDNIRSIADELGLALETFLFIDDNPVERARVRARLPAVEAWGEDPFSLRRRLLNDPRLQLPRVTAEAAARTALTKAQLERAAARAGAEGMSESDFVASLQVQVRVTQVVEGESQTLTRVSELFQRTTQFNTTGLKIAAAELAALLRTPESRFYTVAVSDRFGDHGLVGAAVVTHGDIAGLVLSCRVLGLGVEHEFMRRIIGDLGHARLTGRIVPTARNTPVRNLYRDHDFEPVGDGGWQRVGAR